MAVWTRLGPSIDRQSQTTRKTRGFAQATASAARLLLVLAVVALAGRWIFGPADARHTPRQSYSSLHESHLAEEGWRRELERLSDSHQREILRLQQNQVAETERLTLHHRQDTARLLAISRAEHLRLESAWREQTDRLEGVWQARLNQQASEHQAHVEQLKAAHAHAQQRLEAGYRGQLVDMSTRVGGMLSRLSELESSKQALVQSLGVKPPAAALTSSKPTPPAQANSRATTGTASPAKSAAKSAATPARSPAPPRPNTSTPTNKIPSSASSTVSGGQGGPMKWPPLFHAHETSLAEQLEDASHRLSEMDLALAAIQAQWRKDFSRIEHLPVALPLRVDFKISSGFGLRSDPFNGLRAMHEGVDLIARHGSPVLATAGGVVTRSGRAGAHGQMVEIRHAEGWVTRYAHLSRRLVNEGERVERGDVIGQLGNTGRSSGAHLHYELEHHGRILDPLRALGSLSWRR